MAKKSKADREDPKSNKSLAIRTVLGNQPHAKASEVVAAVEQEFGHKVSPTLVYLVKSKMNLKKTRRRRKAKGAPVAAPLAGNANWIESIRLARKLLQASGSVDNAVAILRAVEG